VRRPLHDPRLFRCRLSKALALAVYRVDPTTGVLVLATVKNRPPGVYRAVPVPPALLGAPDLVRRIGKLQARRGKGRGERLWPSCFRVPRQTLPAARADKSSSPVGARILSLQDAKSAACDLNGPTSKPATSFCWGEESDDEWRRSDVQPGHCRRSDDTDITVI
jgi:hypothetical protein